MMGIGVSGGRAQWSSNRGREQRDGSDNPPKEGESYDFLWAFGLVAIGPSNRKDLVQALVCSQMVMTHGSHDTLN